jgi:hypothetical protein
VAGVHGRTSSAEGTAGLFESEAGADLLRGVADGTTVFEVSADGSVTSSSFVGDGSGMTNVAPGGHTHAGSDIDVGQVGEAFIAASIARDTEILPKVLAGDGPGSGLDADLLDGAHASAFATAAALGAHVGNTGNPHSVTATQVSPTTTKGDLEVRHGSGQVVRLPAGTPGQVLKAAPSFSTGLAWSRDNGIAPGYSCPPGSYVAGLSDTGLLVCRASERRSEDSLGVSPSGMAGVRWGDGRPFFAYQQLDYFGVQCDLWAAWCVDQLCSALEA